VKELSGWTVCRPCRRNNAGFASGHQGTLPVKLGDAVMDILSFTLMLHASFLE
jgi:hypothetical protein